MSLPPGFERSPIRALVAQTSGRKKRKDYASRTKSIPTLTGYQISIKLTRRSQVE
jgi:hypothetical protein